MRFNSRHAIVLLFPLFFVGSLPATDAFRVATYNVENYLDQARGTRPAKSIAAKAKVSESILALKPDVIALQEIGRTNELFELQAALKTNGLDLQFWELVNGWDTNIHVAVLSRFPIVERSPQTNDSYLISGKRFFVSRGFAEVRIQVNSNYDFTLITAHLKSRRPIPAADQADMRLEEAKILREKIDACISANPQVNLIVLGDLNDLHNSSALKTVIGGRGKKSLIDIRPAECDGGKPDSDHRLASRTVTWTHFYAVEDTYSRIDYILLNHNMARACNMTETYVLNLPDWGLASDHRPLVATFSPP